MFAQFTSITLSMVHIFKMKGNNNLVLTILSKTSLRKTLANFQGVRMTISWAQALQRRCLSLEFENWKASYFHAYKNLSTFFQICVSPRPNTNGNSRWSSSRLQFCKVLSYNYSAVPLSTSQLLGQDHDVLQQQAKVAYTWSKQANKHNHWPSLAFL